jgi:hypothetical protein
LSLTVDSDPAERRSANGAYYRNLSKVAEALTFREKSGDRPQDDKADAASAQALLDAAPTQDQLNELGKLSGYWFANPQGAGIVVSGVVKSSGPKGKLFESTVETLGKPANITVVSPSPLTSDSKRPLIVAGAIVNDPAKNLPQYEGDVPRVVWAALTIDPMGSADDSSSELKDRK